MRWIYISPHFDDAVLSCGGLIWEQTHSGIPVEIWTVNAADPPPGPPSDLITRVHSDWKTGTPLETVEVRRIEDQNAARRLGATVLHLDLVDAMYRRTNTGSLMYTRDVFDPIHPRENNIIEKTTHQLSQNLTQYDTIVCPLGLGSHVDHIITRKAAEALARPVWYYADIPYLFKHESELAPAVEGMHAKTFFISAKGLAAWQEGISAYVSQVSSLFGDLNTMQTQITNYLETRNGLTIWDKN
jgi:LmbE family N-acetylglucosaminyl deacetylase